MDQAVFLREFWACFRRLEDAADEMVGKAAYFRFLTLLGARWPGTPHTNRARESRLLSPQLCRVAPCYLQLSVVGATCAFFIDRQAVRFPTSGRRAPRAQPVQVACARGHHARPSAT